jgi:hypothetical protein
LYRVTAVDCKFNKLTPKTGPELPKAAASGGIRVPVANMVSKVNDPSTKPFSVAWNVGIAGRYLAITANIAPSGRLLSGADIHHNFAIVDAETKQMMLIMTIVTHCAHVRRYAA